MLEQVMSRDTMVGDLEVKPKDRYAPQSFPAHADGRWVSYGVINKHIYIYTYVFLVVLEVLV